MAAVQIQVSQREQHKRNEMKKEDIKLIKDLIGLYLKEDFDPFAKDVGREEADSTAEPESEFPYDTEKLGKVLAKCGDDLLDEKSKGSQSAAKLEENQNLLKSLFDKVKNEEEAWKGFKEIMDNSLKDNGLTGPSDPIKVLRSCLLTIHGLKFVGNGVKKLVRVFTHRFIEEKHLDEDIKRIGGLKDYLESQID